MEVALLGARLILVAVFLVAGIAKFSDLRGTQQAVLAFGFPVRLINPLSILLPLSEVLVGILLIPITTTWWGAIGAFLLLSVFCLSISINLLRGRQPDCHCFGQIHSAPISLKTLARNALLIIDAGFIIL